MNQVSTVGLDLAKHIFQLHGADSAGAVVFRKKLRRGQLLAFLATLPPCTVAMEACGSAHYWGREIAKLGGVEGPRLGRELAHLLVGHARKRPVDLLGPQPAQMRDEPAHTLRARPRRLRLDLIPRRTRGPLRHGQESVQASPLF